jgi:SAM-dependent methyltransferase
MSGDATAVDMASGYDSLYAYWRKEIASFREFREARPEGTYRDWQPAKWQSLGRIADAVVRETAKGGSPIGSALELGCGSATFLVQLARRGISGTGVDRVYTALELARVAAQSVGASGGIQLICADFVAPETSALPMADLVCSGGVIEHWDRPGQLHVLEIHRSRTRRWILIGVPNLDSPVFSSFVRWAKANDRFYSDEHFDISVPDLADELGMTVAWEDGCHLFLGQGDYYVPGDPELDGFYAELKQRLVEHDPARFASFPDVDFTGADVETLAAVEEEVEPIGRRRFGFMTFYLIDAG